MPHHITLPASAVNTDHSTLPHGGELLFAKQHRCPDPITATRLEAHKKAYQQRCEAFQAECENFVRRLSVAASEFITPKVQPGSHDDSPPGHTLPYDELDSIVNIMSKTATTTITMFVDQIEQWKDDFVKHEGKTAVTETHLEEFLSHLSNTLSQMTNLQQNHSALLKDSSHVRPQLELTSLVGDRDGTVASLRAEVAQIKNVSATMAQQIATLREHNRILRDNISSQTGELEQTNEQLLATLGSTFHELDIKMSLIEEQDKTIASFGAEVSQLGQSQQIPTLHQDYATLQRDSSPQTAELQERCEVLSKELHDSKTLVEEQGRKVANLDVEIEQLKLADATMAKQLDIEREEKEKLEFAYATMADRLNMERKEREKFHQESIALSSQLSALRERCDAQSKETVSLYSDLQAKEAQLAEQEHTITTITAECDKSRRENEVKAVLVEELTAASSEKADLQERCNSQLVELNKLRKELAQMEHLTKIPASTSSDHHIAKYVAPALEKEKGKLRQTPAAATPWNNDLGKSQEVLSSKDNTVDDGLTEIKKRYEEETKALKIALESSQSQLRAVQRFIATADVHGDEAIIHVLKKLNAEIQQNTTFMAEDIAEQFKQTTSTREVVEKAKERASRSIGHTLADYLANMGPDEMALYLSIAFQACFSCSLCQIISSWTIEEVQNDFIDKIYEQLREAGKSRNSVLNSTFPLTLKNLVNRGTTDVGTLEIPYAYLHLS